LGVEIFVGAPLGVYDHAYTHFRVTLHAFCCTLSNGDCPQTLQVEDFKWVTAKQLLDYPMGKIDRMISKDLLSGIQNREISAC
jgi:A/G-specific adenine glycosylase